MKRDWESYFNKPNIYGVIPHDWENKDAINNCDSPVICFCPICESKFISAKISKVVLETNSQVKSCQRCSRIRIGESKRKQLVFIGETYGDLEVIEIIQTPGNITRVKVKCKCGTEFIVQQTNLVRKDTPVRHCIKCGNICSGDKRMCNIIPGTFFGMLEAIEAGEPEFDGTHYRSTTVCLCHNCGTKCVKTNHQLQSNNVFSCGCITSIGEYMCRIFFNSYGIDFSTQFTFNDLISSGGRHPLFDFALFKNKQLIALVEFQGEQHYKDKGDFGRLQREETDALKKEYCREHNILLYEIKFDEDVETRVNEILTELNLIKEVI